MSPDAPPDDDPLASPQLRTAWHPLLILLPPEVRVAGLKPEDRLAGLSPTDRLAGVAPAEALLALPDEVLRALAPEYLATLPADVQAVVRARLAR